MSMIGTSATTTGLELLTRTSIIKRVLREGGFGTYGTATGGTTSTLIDTTRLQSSQYSEDMWTGAWLRIGKDAGGAAAAPETEIRPITKYEPGNGRLIVSPVFTASPVSTDEYQIFKFPHPQDVLDTIDQILTDEAYLPAQSMLSEIADFDMEQTHTTDWADTNATVTKATTGIPGNGKRWLSVVTTSANGYAESAVVTVEPGRLYHLSALVRANAASTTPTLIAYDSTNSAAITTKTTTRQHWHRLWFTFTTPATCNRVTVRLSNAENSVTSFWDDVVMYSTEAQSIALPWWVKHPDQVKGIYRLTPNTYGTDVMVGDFRGERVDGKWDILPDDMGRGVKAVARQGTINDPLYIKGTRNEVAFSNDNTDTKHVDANWMNARLAFKLYDQLAAFPGANSLDESFLERQTARWTARNEIEMKKQARRVAAEETSQSPWGLYGGASERTFGVVRH